jgi:hypothetical protein
MIIHIENMIIHIDIVLLRRIQANESLNYYKHAHETLET